MSTLSTTYRWDIFCRVIDNYGDIGVCWRLARQLSREYGQQVRLWLDDLHALQRLWPQHPIRSQHQVEGIYVCQWGEHFPSNTEPADIVIEAFACNIPDTYLTAMATLKHTGKMPLWINLEYLSAESWVDDCHNMTSIHPATGLRKTFFFPGFSPRTGGLLREQSLPAERDSFNANAWLRQLGISPWKNALRISLFSYENPGIAQLLDCWRHSSTPIHCLVPNGKVLTSLQEILGAPLLPGQPQQLGSLRLEAMPFVSQTEYDRLLWSSDLNVVRGEDSFVRAQWAAKPFLWHIYPQEEAAHIAKLDAFLARYTRDMPPELAQSLAGLWHAWNQPEPGGNIALYWHKCLVHREPWQAHSQGWYQMLLVQPDLVSQLVALAKNTTETRQTTV
ncbi:elongation factor P maturation arginine rhamnosyltransferase EarP [Cellvibrio japonicus]|uniref:Protein-arginine rhamnosyltransferase n=1 Tax=Cellvibrio japonicus (strain Ueda107) TaxID=498211 RepID=B3PIK8_CELJU|nr:elongation factor P maturation arginine rhamnosyltransferase EarP [Cellvibrio japonicus]ACE85380.1 conserved hypothetical protein [Cellvibrio japonicus Ueda107]QEI12603.1 elongation factor P maturation arginine rhamnosyltransferase EarP [Cellvibrio japonicus]QEI16177.1 elongation factor P maturation arginine rhamnosyltransferase EarP [Cellvibrio japonicus]QEI19755.1 elongation factor P maturation arginine rhamnosyltransferase EarP [Cellvibrio japonicus]